MSLLVGCDASSNVISHEYLITDEQGEIDSLLMSDYSLEYEEYEEYEEGEFQAEDIRDKYDLIFDPYYYYDRYKSTLNIGFPTKQKLKRHFMTHGMRLGYQGNEEFNVQSYMARYDDLQDELGADYKPYYYHYMNVGAEAGLDGSFDQDMYDKAQLDLEALKNKALEISDEEVSAYYDKAVFIGDSVMVGYMYYASSHEDACGYYSDYLAQYSTAIRHSIVDVEEDPYQPSYKGEKINVWNATCQMDIDKVFIMYGTNDIGVYDPERTYGLYVELIDKIRETTPGVEINIISMTPVCAEKEGKGLNNANVNIFNQMIIDGALEHNYYYVALNPCLLDDDGCLIESYSSDKFVHMVSAAYEEIWDPVFRAYAKDRMSGRYELPASYADNPYSDIFN